MSKHYTAEEAKQLLDGATPGPWEHDGESGVRGPRETDDLGRGPALLAVMQMPHRYPRKRHNAALMAAAPEAVAEVIRLRRELEEISIGLERKAERAQRNGAYSAAVGCRETAKKITCILNGENHV